LREGRGKKGEGRGEKGEGRRKSLNLLFMLYHHNFVRVFPLVL
jgi:hypothetical protein